MARTACARLTEMVSRSPVCKPGSSRLIPRLSAILAAARERPLRDNAHESEIVETYPTNPQRRFPRWLLEVSVEARGGEASRSVFTSCSNDFGSGERNAI